METLQLAKLRRQQLWYTNLEFILYGAIVFTLIGLGMTSRVVYSVMATIFLVSPISLLLRYDPSPLLSFFPAMKELMRYEREKLKDAWYQYYASTLILHFAVSSFFFIQAWIRDAESPFIEGIPIWYILVISLILLIVGNVNQHFHAKRIDQKTYEDLKEYSYDKMLFSLVFSIVSLVITGIAIIVVITMNSIPIQ